MRDQLAAAWIGTAEATLPPGRAQGQTGQSNVRRPTPVKVRRRGGGRGTHPRGAQRRVWGGRAARAHRGRSPPRASQRNGSPRARAPCHAPPRPTRDTRMRQVGSRTAATPRRRCTRQTVGRVSRRGHARARSHRKQDHRCRRRWSRLMGARKYLESTSEASSVALAGWSPPPPPTCTNCSVAGSWAVGGLGCGNPASHCALGSKPLLAPTAGLGGWGGAGVRLEARSRTRRRPDAPSTT